MSNLRPYYILLAKCAYLHIFPGDGLAGMIAKVPGYQNKLDGIVTANLCDLLNLVDCLFPERLRNADALQEWCSGKEPNPMELESYLSFTHNMPEVIEGATPNGWTVIEV